jgi:hypothetical protein
MPKKYLLAVSVLLSTLLLACGDGNEAPKERSYLSEKKIYQLPKISFPDDREILEGDKVLVSPIIDIDSTLTYTIKWSISNGEHLGYSIHNGTVVLKNTAVTQDTIVTFTATVVDSRAQSTQASFILTIVNEDIS